VSSGQVGSVRELSDRLAETGLVLHNFPVEKARSCQNKRLDQEEPMLDELLDHAADWAETVAPWTGVNYGLRLARDIVRYGTLLWITRGCTPRERALAFAAMHRPRQGWRRRR